MRRRTFGADGDPVEAEDVLDPQEAAEYRATHPRPPMHQIRFYPEPENACDECQAELQPDDGALCLYCALRYEEDRNS